MIAWLALSSAIAAGIAGGVWLAGILRALRWAIGIRLYAYATRVRERAAPATVIAIDETAPAGDDR